MLLSMTITNEQNILEIKGTDSNHKRTIIIMSSIIYSIIPKVVPHELMLLKLKIKMKM